MVLGDPGAFLTTKVGCEDTGQGSSTMTSAGSWAEAVALSSDDSDSDSKAEGVCSTERSNKSLVDKSTEDVNPEAAVIKRVEMYQEYMKQIPIPTNRGSVIPFTTWQGLAKSLKKLYGQPLHYLTNITLKQWDELRIGADDEHLPLDTIIHPCKAEATIWLMEEVHRLTSSHHHLVELWASDPMHHAFVDPVIKKK
ncbi:hypothetical protein MRB53_026506 [Persea americana]|uniref:Uncharacterized protein n=1 Tax=Persea americana TaxID=3435 RepID=A0ACC2LIT4_PERAE|nr:hypothetical protein MRB53_026506 [Persea americana]|eukprot:TRINITY_DN4730_c0_g1_i1.p1 TRINITY_DN4730_c0_g1~~TRINITY_DN4730_c0_g1_i1.p1  ORF type:complete len:196 (-),score=38.40 TRINITY_DN4730_c0_g1_i1:200-787(-)